MLEVPRYRSRAEAVDNVTEIDKRLNDLRLECLNQSQKRIIEKQKRDIKGLWFALVLSYAVFDGSFYDCRAVAGLGRAPIERRPPGIVHSPT